jgi:glutaredoxin 3
MSQKNKLTIKIYTTKTCGYCFLAKNLLERNNYTYTEIDVSGRENIRQKMIKLSNGLRTVPQIFIRGKHIGGFAELNKIHLDGKLI